MFSVPHKSPDIFPVGISPDNWARVEPLITSALELDRHVEAMEIEVAMMKVKGIAIHKALWEQIQRLYPQLKETPCHINVAERRIEATAMEPFASASRN